MLIHAHESYILQVPVVRGQYCAFSYLHISYRLDLPSNIGSFIKIQVLKRKRLGFLQ